MTKQEVHNCDICGELFYVPQETLRNLKFFENGEELFDHDLCPDCWKKFAQWIDDVREGKK